MVKTFSDDGQSKWVNALVPGFGKCTVERDHLEFCPINVGNGSFHGITTITIDFEDYESNSDGLPRFLQTIEFSLKYLTLNWNREVDENLILQQCPNLEELVLHKNKIHVRLTFAECYKNQTPLPELNCDWDDIETLAETLSDVENELAGCVRRLRYQPIIGQMDDTEDELKAILKMLDDNNSLEYVDIVVPSSYHSEVAAFREFHLQPIDRSLPLPTECKVAFLSVLSWSRLAMENTEILAGSVWCPALCELDRLVLSNIFAFAQSPILRKVYLHEEYANIGGDPLDAHVEPSI